MRQWRGAWSNEADEWSENRAVREQLHPGAEWDHALTWMTFADMCANFSLVFMVAEVPEGWASEVLDGVLPGAPGAGGHPRLPDFAANPQYAFSVSRDTKLTITMQQPDARMLGAADALGAYLEPINFVCCILSEAKGALHRFSVGRMFGSGPSFVTGRQVCASFDVPPCRAVIIPCAFRAGAAVPFSLQVRSNQTLTWLPAVAVSEEADSDEDDEEVDAAAAGAADGAKGGSAPGHDAITRVVAARPVTDEAGRSVAALQAMTASLAQILLGLQGDVQGLEATLAAALQGAGRSGAAPLARAAEAKR